MTRYLLGIFLLVSLSCSAQSEEIPLYSGAAPGSQDWNWSEKVIDTDLGRILMDVSNPSLTVCRPKTPNGTAIIIAPGGAFHALAFDHEGIKVGERLAETGITAFVLKYRVVHDDPAHPENSIGNLMATKNFSKLDSINAAVIPLALQDGIKAMQYVRTHAKEYGIATDKIGFMGFSAGGTLTMSVVYSAESDSRPNFVAPIYAYENAIIGTKVPTTPTPIFIAAASDDDLGFAMHSVHLYEKWLSAGQPAELHMYEKGKHGFGTKQQGLPVDNWMNVFIAWLAQHGYSNTQ